MRSTKKFFYYLLALACAASISFFQSCKKDGDSSEAPEAIHLSSVSIPQFSRLALTVTQKTDGQGIIVSASDYSAFITAISSTGASFVLQDNISANGGSAITEVGFIWAVTLAPNSISTFPAARVSNLVLSSGFLLATPSVSVTEVTGTLVVATPAGAGGIGAVSASLAQIIASSPALRKAYLTVNAALANRAGLSLDGNNYSLFEYNATLTRFRQQFWKISSYAKNASGAVGTSVPVFFDPSISPISTTISFFMYN